MRDQISAIAITRCQLHRMRAHERLDLGEDLLGHRDREVDVGVRVRERHEARLPWWG